MTKYVNFNNSSESFRIFCDKASSLDICKNLILESLNNDIELRTNQKKIIFNNDVIFNGSMDLSNRSLSGLTKISANNLNLISSLSNFDVNISNKVSFTNPIYGNNLFLTSTADIQDLSRSFFHNITLYANTIQTVIVDINITLYCCYGANERISVELWRDLTMLSRSAELGSVVASGGMQIPYSLTYIDENLTRGQKRYYLKYKLETNNSLEKQGIINVRSFDTPGSSNIILRATDNSSNYYNKKIFDSSSFTTTTDEIQDMSDVLFNTINVFDNNIQININFDLYCCCAINERISVEVWRDLSMLSQSSNLGISNTTGGLTIPFYFSYLDKNLINGPKKYYLKYKLENKIPNIQDANEEGQEEIKGQGQGIVNLSTTDSIGSSNILLTKVSKNNNNLTITNNNHFTTTTSEIQDLSNSLYTMIAVNTSSTIFIDLNIELLSCYAYGERITLEVWRDLSMIYQHINIGNANATSGFIINYRFTFLDENVSIGTKKYYLKYKLESNESTQEQGIINFKGIYFNIENSNISAAVSYNVLSYHNMNIGYIKNTKIGYNPQIEGDQGSSIGRRDAYFTYINVSTGDSFFNDSVYVNKNVYIQGYASNTYNLKVNDISLASMLYKLGVIENYISYISHRFIDFSNISIALRDLSATNITVKNELYVNNNYYINDLSINGQLISSVLKVPNGFTIDQYEFFNNNGTLVVDGDLIVNGNKYIINSNTIDISAYIIKLATNLSSINELSTNPAGLDVSYIASIKYDGVKWNISGGELFIGDHNVGYDASFINLQSNISDTLITTKTSYDYSFNQLQINIDNSFNTTYSISRVDNSFVKKTTFDYSYNNLRDYIINSTLLKEYYNISGEYILQYYVLKSYANSLITTLNNKIDQSFVSTTNVEASYNTLRLQFEASFNNIAARDIDISSIIIESVRTPLLSLASHSTITGGLTVLGDTSINSLNISNKYTFNNNGYSSLYYGGSNPNEIMEEYYSKFNNYGKVLYILADGSLYYLSGLGSLSDIRLKENIVDATPKLQDLLKVRIVNYNLKTSSKKKRIGVLAQELEKIFPGLVSENVLSPRNIESGRTETYKSVKYSCFNVMLIKALQEQQQIITNLALRLERLKQKI